MPGASTITINQLAQSCIAKPLFPFVFVVAEKGSGDIVSIDWCSDTLALYNRCSVTNYPLAHIALVN